MSASLRIARFTSLILATCFGIIGMSVGINALVKSNDQKHMLESNAPMGATVTIDTHDVFDSGVVETVVCGLIALTSFISLLGLFWSYPGKLGLRTTHFLSGHILLFLSIWLFATLVPFTDFVANRAAKISASLEGMPLPPSVIQGFEQELGATPVYHKMSYLRLAVIFPWIAFLFALSSAVGEYVAARNFARTGFVARDASGEVTEDKSGMKQV